METAPNLQHALPFDLCEHHCLFLRLCARLVMKAGAPITQETLQIGPSRLEPGQAIVLRSQAWLVPFESHTGVPCMRARRCQGCLAWNTRGVEPGS
jgi:hypothetical protein